MAANFFCNFLLLIPLKKGKPAQKAKSIIKSNQNLVNRYYSSQQDI